MAPSEPENHTLALLREMRAEDRVFRGRVEEKLDRIDDDLRELKIRMPSVENVVATVNNRLDRMELRLERIERRLDLVET